MHHPRKDGFTLIELLVVIAIIGVLSSTILVNISNAKLSAANAKRISDIRAYANAAESYYIDNGYYPTNSPIPLGSNCIGSEHTLKPCPNDHSILDAIFLQYMPTLPGDTVGVSFRFGHGGLLTAIVNGYYYDCLNVDSNSKCIRAQFVWYEQGEGLSCPGGIVNAASSYAGSGWTSCLTYTQ